MKLNKLLIAVLIAAFGAVGVFAQEDKPVKVGGQIFFFFANELKNEVTTNKDAPKTDQFNVDRVRINVSKEFDSIWSANITAEGSNNVSGAMTTASFFVRNAYISAKVGTDDAKITIMGGVNTNPIILTNDIQRGDRWINKEYYDNSAVDGKSGAGVVNSDYAIINGLFVKAELMKMVTLNLAIANGGNSGAKDETFANSGKAIIGNVVVTPIEGVFINGFVSNFESQIKNTSTPLSDGVTQFNFGGGLGINLMGIRAGFSYAMFENKTEFASGATALKKTSTLLDTYLNANLKELAGMPVLVIARFAMGKAKSDATVDTFKNSDVMIYGVGVGYQFNANVQAALYFENYTFKKDSAVLGANEGARQTIYVKSEAKF